MLTYIHRLTKKSSGLTNNISLSKSPHTYLHITGHTDPSTIFHCQSVYHFRPCLNITKVISIGCCFILTTYIFSSFTTLVYVGFNLVLILQQITISNITIIILIKYLHWIYADRNLLVQHQWGMECHYSNRQTVNRSNPKPISDQGYV